MTTQSSPCSCSSTRTRMLLPLRLTTHDSDSGLWPGPGGRHLVHVPATTAPSRQKGLRPLRSSALTPVVWGSSPPHNHRPLPHNSHCGRSSSSSCSCPLLLARCSCSSSCPACCAGSVCAPSPVRGYRLASGRRHAPPSLPRRIRSRFATTSLCSAIMICSNRLRL